MLNGRRVYNYIGVLQEESHTKGFLSIQIDKYEIDCKGRLYMRFDCFEVKSVGGHLRVAVS